MTLWEILPEESTTAFAAFMAYLEMADQRSVRKVAQKLGKSATLIGRWSSRYFWVERAAAFDRHMADVQQAARKAAEAAEAQKWAHRRQQQREEEFELGQKLIEKAKQMLNLPIVQIKKEEKTEHLPDGRTLIKQITIIEPVRWRFGDAARALEMASKLIRLADGDGNRAG